MQTMILNQIFDSSLSKQGKTTTTGIFEGQPENVLVASRGGLTTPTGEQRIDTPIESVIAFNNQQVKAATYLEHLQQERRI